MEEQKTVAVVEFYSEEAVACCLGFGSIEELLKDYSSVERAVHEIWLDAKLRIMDKTTTWKEKDTCKTK